ncbi:hypothetical protein EK21DRAFT_112595 [Setomelanomma holmii]|uniref:Uncharacterized protein n=1 Tax=Setomelanomma holmii TaxID=210430 RepID=A0A9P4HAS9_9PLEO|nr:hypothetical protein EK21DRAFT_112595 [Setomelanomma holmii]
MAGRDLKCARAVQHLSNLVNLVYMKTREATTALYLESEEATKQDLLLHVCWRGDLTGPYYEPTATTLSGRRAVLSFNQCDNAIARFAGLVAFINDTLQLSIRLEEHHIDGVTATRCMRTYGIEVQEDIADIAPVHTMIRIALDTVVAQGRISSLDILLGIGGIYMDITADQYDRVPGLVSVSQYLAHVTTSRVEKIGSCYEERLNWMLGAEYQAILPVSNTYFEEIVTWIVNNTFYAECNRLGGPTIILDNDDSFRRCHATNCQGDTGGSSRIYELPVPEADIAARPYI